MECRIRTWKMEDAARLASILNNRKILDNLRDGIPYPYTENDAENFIRDQQNAVFSFAVTAGGELLGSIGVFRKDNIHIRTGEIGYYIAEPFWGNGLGTSAVGQICRTVFRHTDIVRIFAEPFAYNTASCRVLEKNGFQYEGTLRSNAVKNGKILDMKLYALIKTDL